MKPPKMDLGPNSPLRELARPKQSRARPEADHELAHVIPLYVSAGFTVNKTSARVHAKGVTPGTPDLHLQHLHCRFEMWHETKILTSDRPGTSDWFARHDKEGDYQGRCDYPQTQAQFAFMERCRDTRTIYVLGNAAAAWRFLSWFGFCSTLGTPYTPRMYPMKEWRSYDLETAERWYASAAFQGMRAVFGWRINGRGGWTL